MTAQDHATAPGPAAADPAPHVETYDRRPPTDGRPLRKYVFIQNDPFYLPRVLDKYLREFGDSTAGVNIQSVAQGGRTVLQTSLALLRMYGPVYFQWKLRRYLVRKLQGKLVNDVLGSTRRCYSVAAVARRYGVPVHHDPDVNAESFRAMLRDLGVELIVSISGTQLYRRPLRDQTPFGIVNCHGALLPAYRGLMPSFWTLRHGETTGGVSVHFVDAKLDNGPIVIQRTYRIHERDTLEDIMARSKDLAAEAIIESVHAIESGDPPMMPNPRERSTHFSMPTREDVQAFRAAGRRFF
jgi:methionyl-tRNA formyltransferase